MKKPNVPDHDVLDFIGSGSYGQVWLARNVLGTFRAVKVVWRESLPGDKHYVGEFEGIRHFEPISRSHPNLVAILQVGRNEHEEYFYYVMELADAVEGSAVGPATERLRQENLRSSYKPRTLSSEFKRRGRFSLKECCELGLALTSGLGRLHQHSLVHRDIKPSNIILIDDVPKIADIGLVTTFSREPSLAGTFGYMPARGHGTAGGDLYSLGKVLYRASTGNDVEAYPELSSAVGDVTDLTAFQRFNDLLIQACHEKPEARFQSAHELFARLNQVFEPAETGAVLRKWWHFLWPVDGPPVPDEQPRLETVGGAVPLASPFYLPRPADDEFLTAIKRYDSIVSVKGARQMGKTSLLARGLEHARQAGNRVILTDFQDFNLTSFVSLKEFYQALAASMEEALNLTVSLVVMWNDSHSPNRNFDRFLRRVLEEEITGRLVWGMDEVDRLFSTGFQDEVFGKLRSIHEKTVLEPDGPWKKLTWAIAFATEAHLLIQDLNRSPFNVGTRIVLQDFNQAQVAKLNELHGAPLQGRKEVAKFTELIGGHPYLTRRGLYEMVIRSWRLDRLISESDNLFEDHLQRLLRSLRKDPELVLALRPVLAGAPCADPDSFYRLRSAGVLAGNDPSESRPRCALYGSFLTRHLPP